MTNDRPPLGVELPSPEPEHARQSSAQPLDPELRSRLEPILATHPGGRSSLVPVLLAIQAELGWLPGPALHLVSEALGVSATQVFEVVSFHSFFTTRPPAHHQIKVCLGTTCFVSQGARILRALEDTLGIADNPDAADGRVGLGHTRCLGACAVAPALIVDGQVFGGQTPNRAVELAVRLRGRKRRGGPGSDPRT